MNTRSTKRSRSPSPEIDHPVLHPPAPELNQPRFAKRPRTDDLSEKEMKKMEKGFGRDIANQVKHAKANKVTMHYFNLESALAAPSRIQQAPSHVVHEWMDGQPRVAVSQDGYPLVVHLPGAIRTTSANILLELLVAFGSDKAIKLKTACGADKTRNAAASYKIRHGQLAGIFKAVKAWLPIGHPDGEPVGSRDMFNTSSAFNATRALIPQLRFLSHRTNCLIDAIDPKGLAQLIELNKTANLILPAWRTLSTGDPLLMEGREFMFNRQTPLHPDLSDEPGFWAALTVVGTFRGGPLYIPCLNLRMLYTHGTMILVRGRLLPHEVEAFSDGQRVTIAHFTHRTLGRLVVLPLRLHV
ncbi:hypothetical protein B0H14DRAFT_3471493 [Mycena olivaceomarginata]|nr:hypothetical protein B0H14DRAFT_3471493 [Mycena olivaceomarginata]